MNYYLPSHQTALAGVSGLGARFPISECQPINQYRKGCGSVSCCDEATAATMPALGAERVAAKLASKADIATAQTGPVTPRALIHDRALEPTDNSQTSSC
jgi:hypothetical protein